MLTAKIILIVTTTFSVVNGKTVDKVVYERPTSFQSTSECYKDIRDKRKRYSEIRSEKRKSGRYAYNYKTISCKTKRVDLGEGELLKEVFSIKW